MFLMRFKFYLSNWCQLEDHLDTNTTQKLCMMTSEDEDEDEVSTDMGGSLVLIGKYLFF